MHETLEQFKARMADMESTEELQVGPWWRGHSRSVFCFERQFCYLESSGYATVPARVAPRVSEMAKLALALKPTSDYWWTDFEVNGRSRAEGIALAYGAEIEAGWYGDDCENTFHFCFRDDEKGEAWDKLMLFVWHRLTGEFEKRYGFGRVAA